MTDDRQPALDPDAFIERWAGSGGAERANAQSFLNDLADTLGVARPDPTTGDPRADGYVYERPLAFQDGTQSKGFIDLYKRGAFVLETKQGADAKRTEGGRKLRTGHGKRGTRAWEATMDAARNQAEGYARNLEASEPPPPFIVVSDVGFCIDLYADFSGSGRLYRPFPDAATHRIPLTALRQPDVRARLATVFSDPLSLDPARRQARVTVDLAAKLAELAASLDGAVDQAASPMDAEAVAGFLSRALFSMFAEDAGLVPEGAFTKLLVAYADDLDHLPHALSDFFAKMDAGGYIGEVRASVRRFNGLLFKDTRSPRLTSEQRAALVEAAKADWSDVEPSIFGTLLERALDPKERHALGAHFTPRAYVERLVGPTILEPLREEWDGARAAASRLIEQAEEARDKGTRTRRRNEARGVLAAFLTRLSDVRVLDPACGSGNFLYVTLAGLKALEDEARTASQRLVGESVGEGFGVTPQNMHGIELNARAAAIADLVLWIGYLQWHRARYGGSQPLPEPVLEGYGQVEHRDAVLADDGSPARWPEADFIVGNPPFIGASRMRDALGDDYTETLRAAYPDVPESADLVMFWWDRAADIVRAGEAERFGLITTNSLPQTFNRRVVERHLSPSFQVRPGTNPNPALALAFAIPDHPWVDAAEGADVRVSMTVGARSGEVDPEGGRLSVVAIELAANDHGVADVDFETFVGRVNADLTVGADTSSAAALESNLDLSNRGVSLFGSGFIVTPEQAHLLGMDRVEGVGTVIRHYRNGRDLMQSPRGVLVIDLFGHTAEEARDRFPEVYEHLLREVKPARDKNRRKSRRENWWLFGETNPKLRRQLDGLARYIVTVETSKHRVFQFLDASILPDNKLLAIALADAFHLGVLSSQVHIEWALAAGGRLGVGNDPVYVKTKCFEPFPFPAASEPQIQHIRQLGEAIDAHRKARQAETGIGLTDLYNALEALRAGRELTTKEAASAEAGLAHTLLDLHRQLDRAVLDAYGWSDLNAEAPTFRAAVLTRLVALNAERRAEEDAGHIRYLRPAFQAPDAAPQTGLALATAAPDRPAETAPRPWPDALAARTVAVRQAVAAGAATPRAVAARFSGARPAEVAEVLDALAELGLVRHVGAEFVV